MKLTALRLFNVRRFGGKGVAIEGIGEGVNVLCAANEHGKSTSFDALHALFFQPHSSTGAEVRALRPYSGGSPLVQAEVATGKARYRITKQFYGGRSAQVFDLDAERLIAQADEAETFIAGLVDGGAGGPAGLLWVRQGVTGLERRSTREEENEKQARTGLLESVQGEVEAVTGGRRMADIIAAVSEERLTLVTPTGRAKAGGRYAVATEARDRLIREESRLSGEVSALREALDRRAKAMRDLAELEDADDRAARHQATQTAQAAFDAAKARDERLRTARAEHDLARQRHDNADQARRRFEDALGEAKALSDRLEAARRRQDEAVAQRQGANDAIEKARTAAKTAETEEAAARALLDRLDAAEKAREARERVTGLTDRLRQAEEARQAIEDSEAQFALAKIPAGAIDELANLEAEIATMRAVRDSGRPSVMVTYDGGVAGRITMAGEPLAEGVERGFDGHARLVAPGLGTITLRSNQPVSNDQLEEAEVKHSTLLASMGVTDLAAARTQQERAQQFETKAREGRAQLALLAPDGLARLQEDVAAHAQAGAEPLELIADPAETRAVLDDAAHRRSQASQDMRDAEPLRASAEAAFVRSQTDLTTIQAEMGHVVAVLGPEESRDARRQELTDKLAPLKTALEEAEAKTADLEATAHDIEFAQAALNRALSIEQAVDDQIVQLREDLAGLNAEIRARSDDAVEENWREIHEELGATQNRVTAFEREVALLQRLSDALEAARAQARDLYLKPVMTELKPLLGMLFDDVSVSFDEGTLLPQTISRNGLEEEIERLSGGMREQLSVLTRLAFARLFARDGRPAPVVLDDALVYSDDDRIEKMFDALHRQARDQQIIVFSCRQRAFQKLGGNVLRMTDWQP
jgi:DNA repair exonuclease SbcCD ATPase subunit